MEGSNLPLKKAHIEKRDSPFASAAGRTRSYQEEAAVAPELRSQLESIGMRTRFSKSDHLFFCDDQQLIADDSCRCQ